MKKIIYLLPVFLITLISSVYSTELTTSIVSQYNTEVSTTSNVGVLIPNTVAKARIAKITITYEITTTTGTIKLYANNRGTSSTLVYSVVLPSTTSQGQALIQESYDMGLPKVVRYGLLAIHEGGTGKKPVIVIEYW